MRWIQSIISIVLVLSVISCAGNPVNGEHYMAYLMTIESQEKARATAKPLVDLKLDGSGRLQAIAMSQPMVHREVKEFKPMGDPTSMAWARTTERLIGLTGILGGIYLTGQALEGIVDSVGSTTYTNSFNASGGNLANMPGLESAPGLQQIGDNAMLTGGDSGLFTNTAEPYVYDFSAVPTPF